MFKVKELIEQVINEGSSVSLTAVKKVVTELLDRFDGEIVKSSSREIRIQFGFRDEAIEFANSLEQYILKLIYLKPKISDIRVEGTIVYVYL